jgi:predicted amino acid racemase
MLLARALQRNPEMIEAAIDLHRRGVIPAATYMIDLDAIAANARAMADEIKRCGLRSYLMTKQSGRNPYATAVALAQGIDSTVAVEAIEARVINRYGLPLGHVGHLSNIPQAQVAAILAMDPEVVTVFTYEAAKAVSDAARALGREQNLYVRVNRTGDEFFRGMVGGFTEEDCVAGVRPILDLPNVRVSGLTAFVNISYKTTDARVAQPTDCFFTMLRAKEKLERELGLCDLRVNAPGFNSCATFRTLADHGATDVEPGMALIGSSLTHAHSDLAEKPAQVYVTEVMHHWEGEAYVLGGGLSYIQRTGGDNEYDIRCIAGRSFDEARDNFLTLADRGVIDYHGVCSEGDRARVGDTAIFALRAQLFYNRCYVAVVSGIASGEPALEAIFDSAVNMLDEDLMPVPLPVARERVERCIAERYAGTVGRPT